MIFWEVTAVVVITDLKHTIVRNIPLFPGAEEGEEKERLVHMHCLCMCIIISKAVW